MEQKLALNILKAGHNVFLTGAAGTGKSYCLNQYINYLKKNRVKYAIAASTGIAASHINGQTIHSWSGMGIKDEISPSDLASIKSKKFQIAEVAVLIIDEISMLHSKQFALLNQILKYCRESAEPFGGIQIIVCGDFFQLPPVERNIELLNSRYCFMSKDWVEASFNVCYLTVQYRQKDNDLANILNEIRANTVAEDSIELLKNTISRVRDDDIPKLYTHNDNVEHINNKRLHELEGVLYNFECKTVGMPSLCEMILKQSRINEVFEYKIGAQVMFNKNNKEAGYVNGTCGVVTKVIKDDELGTLPVVLTHDKEEIIVTPESWSILDEDGNIKASVEQLPLRLAWAITVHKSQGMTMDAAEIDLTNAFECGQGYVALSRLRSLEGMRLIGLNPMATLISPLVRKADARFIELSGVIEQQYQKYSFLADHKKFVASSISRFGASKFATGGKGKPDAGPKATAAASIEIEQLLKDKDSLTEISIALRLSQHNVYKHIKLVQETKPSLDIERLRPESELLEATSRAVKKYYDKPRNCSFDKTNLKFVLNAVREEYEGVLEDGMVWQALLFISAKGDVKSGD